MIIVTDALNRDRHTDIIDEMYRLRARVFQGRLGWDVKVTDGREIDEFDTLDPVYIIALDDDGHVVGCMRLLQTTGPHMLSDVFHEILDGEPPLRSAQVWEATRFCVDTERLARSGGAKNSISYVTSEVMIAAFEYGRAAGILDAVAVIDPVMNRVMIRSGNAPYDYLGTAKPMGKVTAMAALMDCSEERVARLRDFSGITHDVFTPENIVRAAFDAARSKPTTHDHLPSALRSYLDEQIAAAVSADEQAAARALAATLSARFAQEDDHTSRSVH
ncbi:GNAT family N-acetyltransferase [Aquicoccus porphyridii]|uniref:Acyl-homoserine-lactone synthase n=1 Tax=Aquicoccus porphyridii TaxID=1852029 RepID=A0A5A9ZTT5_9RHOB|nr:acyl-homoserine-lactone synthase [Aquicoccus porphyridii]KAA0920744.1 GNAT family N-acetyltransferase [Aquicoccus porphyridii]RAI56705.1 autoinducer synthase [Rhodobacteraceae bacterium AsT-22]